MNFIGLKSLSFIQWAKMVYGSKGESYYEIFQNIKPYHGIKAPQSLQMRYITEDVPTGLVPISSLGKYLNIPTPTTNSIIGLANALFNFDFYKNGRTIEKVGIPLQLIRDKYVKEHVSKYNYDFTQFE